MWLLFASKTKGSTVVLPLDTLNADLGVSVRLLKSSFWGSNLMRVRRASDNAESDIGHLTTLDINNNYMLDTDALMSFVGYQNLLTYSEQFDYALAWPVFGATVAANGKISPFGEMTADTITENSVASTQHRFTRTFVSVVNGTTYTLSVYVRRDVGTRQFQLGLSQASPSVVCRAYFNLGTGAVGDTANCTAAITAVDNGYYRVSLTYTATGNSNANIFMAMTNGTTLSSETYSGDGTSSLDIFGAQLNFGSEPQGYAGTTAAPTNGDGYVVTWYDQTGGGNHETQADMAYQPRIVTSGEVLTRNGYPTVRSLTQNQGLAVPFAITSLDARTVVSAVTIDTMNATGQYVGDSNTAYAGMDNATTASHVTMRNGTSGFTAPNSWPAGVDNVLSLQYTGASSIVLRDGVELYNNVDAYFGWAATNLRIFYCGFLNRGVIASAHELLYYRSALGSTDRSAIEQSQGTAFGITVA